MISVPEFATAVIKEMTSINGTQGPWFGAVNKHDAMWHFTVMKIFNNVVYIFHVNAEKLTSWETFANETIAFFKRNKILLDHTVQDRE